MSQLLQFKSAAIHGQLLQQRSSRPGAALAAQLCLRSQWCLPMCSSCFGQRALRDHAFASLFPWLPCWIRCVDVHFWVIQSACHSTHRVSRGRCLNPRLLARSLAAVQVLCMAYWTVLTIASVVLATTASGASVRSPVILLPGSLIEESR